MQKRFLLQFRNFDVILFVSTLLLVTIGLLVQYSSGITGSGVINQIDASKQLLYVIVGLTIFLLVSRTDYRVWRSYSTFFYILMLALLFIVAFFGATRLGATRWINLGFFQFQPSEFAKLAIIVFFAKYFSSIYTQSNKLKYLLVSILYLAPPVILVLAQPDLGTAMVLSLIWLVMALITRVNKLYFVAFIGVIILAVPVIMPHLATYQRQRITTFLNPAANPSGTGYNVNQAIIAVGSGGLLGQGLSSGSQSQGNFLPSQHTDFVFAVLSEKLGFLGGTLTILLFSTIIVRAIFIANVSSDYFGTFLAIGIATMFAIHVGINIAMNIGLVPVTGIPLPFISAGGTSMIISLLSVGILESIYARRRTMTINTKEVYE